MRVLIVLLVFAAVLAGCTTPPPIPPTPAPTVAVTATTAPTPAAQELPPPTPGECAMIVPMQQVSEPLPTPGPVAIREATPASANQPASLKVPYVDGDLIIAGKANEIEAVVKAVNEDVFKSNEGGLTWNERELLVPPSEDRFSIETRLYHFTPTPEFTAASVAERVREIAIRQESAVFADPNFIGFANTQQGCALEGSPLSGEGSPLSGEGSPLSGEGSPMGVPPGVAPAKLYWQQWALGEEWGIHLAVGGERRDIAKTGEAARIIIFDTSPFPRAGKYTFDGAGWPKPSMTLCVEHPVPVNISETSGCAKTLNQSDHGVFVAGLTYAVAPQAQLRLVRVLDDYGRGDLKAFLYALGNIPRQELENAVLNMSLGFLPIKAEPADSLETVCKTAGLADCRALLKLLADPATRPPDLVKALVDREGMTLYLAIRNALDANAIIVAAAGNYSDGAGARPAQMPAAFTNGNPTLLAVAGTTKQGARSFFSHAGTLAAPAGGNDVNRCEAGASPDCQASLDYWLISVARHEDGTADEYWSYGAWMGTSFATPLVSGAAALELAGGADPVNAAKSVAASVRAPASADGALGAGILRLP